MKLEENAVDRYKDDAQCAEYETITSIVLILVFKYLLINCAERFHRSLGMRQTNAP